MSEDKSDLEERLFKLMKEYQQPVSGFNYWLVGITGGLVLLAGAAFLGYQLKPSPQIQPTPTIEEIAVVPTDTPFPTFTPEPTPTYTPEPSPTPTRVLPTPTDTPIPTATPTLTFTPTQTPLFDEIVFSSDDNYETPEKEGGIYIMKSDGSNVKRFDPLGGSYESPQWFPDHRRILFVFHDGQGHYNIYSMKRDGTDVWKLTDEVEARYPSLSPDGNKIVFVSNPQLKGVSNMIYLMDADGSNKTLLAQNLPCNEYPSWSPDGKRIACVSADPYGNWDLYVTGLNGDNQKQLINDFSFVYGPSWYPDGSKIIFTGHSGSDQNSEIYMINADGTNLIKLTNDSAIDLDPSFSHDGNKIIFSSTKGKFFDIYIMNADGSNVTRLTHASNTSYKDPSW